MSRSLIAALALAALLALPSGASAGNYPPPSSPSAKQKKPQGPFRTLTVCKQGCRYRTIQSAVSKAHAGDKVKVRNGVYREGVSIAGAARRYLRLVGNPGARSKVVIDGALGGSKRRQNGVIVNGANQVTVDGITVRNYNGNGVFLTNVTGYHVNHVSATRGGVYGIYAFNSIGGLIENSEASQNNDSGLYIGQTPPQAKPVRSFVRNVKSHTNVLGFSGTNMKYVTITKSQWFNNGAGIIPNALDSEKYAPPEDNEISDNDIYWNNFNFYAGAPFKDPGNAASGTAYPIGVGILLFGSRRTEITNNRIDGNWLAGVGAIKQIILKQADAADLIGNRIHDNVFGSGGTDLNGRELAWDGNGSDNCWGPNTGVRVTVGPPAAFGCPFTGANASDPTALTEMLSWVGDTTHEKFWVRSPHRARAGVTPLERWKK